MKSSMKRLAFLMMILCGVAFTACSDVEKGRNAYDKGVNLMFNYSRFAEAEEQFTLAIKYDKNNYEAYYYRGCTKFNRGMMDESILDFEKALEVKPDYADAYFALGRVYFIKQDRDMSCYYFRLAERFGKDNMDDYVKACPE